MKWRLRRSLPLPAETLRVLGEDMPAGAVAIDQEVAEAPAPQPTEVHGQVAGLLGSPRPGGVRGDAQDVQAPESLTSTLGLHDYHLTLARNESIK